MKGKSSVSRLQQPQILKEKLREVRNREQIYDYRRNRILGPFPLTLQGVSQRAWLKPKWCSCLVFHSPFPLETWNPVLHEGDRLLQVADIGLGRSDSEDKLLIILQQLNPRKGMNWNH